MASILQRRQSLSSQLVAELRALIDKGTFKPGDKIPSENELMTRYSVSRTVVREAISGLRADGLLETRQGVGAFVTRRPKKRLDPFDPQDMQAVLHIIEFRLAFEPEVAGIAAKRRTKADLIDLKAKFDDLHSKSLDANSFVKPDYEFHLAIAKAAHNPYLIQLGEHLGPQIIPHSIIHVLAPEIPEDMSFLKRVRGEHEDIYRAIVEQKPQAARKAMKSHLKNSLALYSQYLDL